MTLFDLGVLIVVIAVVVLLCIALSDWGDGQ